LEAAAANTGLPVKKMDPIDESSTVHIGGFTLTFLHTPGHSPGSVVVQINNSGDNVGDGGAVKDSGDTVALITGDMVFPGSCGRLDLPESEPVASFADISSLVCSREAWWKAA
jgi:glyoxylase-like metal-dependent hydrolase (beta-lactamase superfamily II)